MKVEVSSRSTPYEFRSPHGRVLFCMEEAKVSHERFDGRMSPVVKRVNFSRGDSVAVLLYARETDEVVLVEQFRYPVYAGYPESERDGKGWILETVAGIKDARGPDVARREILEETGYALQGELEHLTTVYVSPGGTSERTELYLARVNRLDGIRRHAGLEAESEDIRPHAIPFAEALRMAGDGRIVDSKTVIALYMLKERLDGSGEA
ncbi:MAG: NUDIX hydrolase [Gemmatimonadota bacterium]|nr:NUDIX hydrolase [Gemmatimonadota bacterium]